MVIERRRWGIEIGGIRSLMQAPLSLLTQVDNGPDVTSCATFGRTAQGRTRPMSGFFGASPTAHGSGN